MLNLLSIVIGILFIFVVPGYLLTLIFFKNSKIIEKIILTIMMSISTNILISLFLGFNEFTYKITGGLIKKNLWIWMIAFSVLLLGYHIYTEKKHNKGKNSTKKKK